MGIGILVTGFFVIIVGAGYLLLTGLFTYGWYRRRPTGTAGSSGEKYKVSVIIAAKNEENNIADLLGDLLNQDYPEDLLEITVVDDHSTDRTHEIVNGYSDKNAGSGISLLKNEMENLSGKKAALHTGIIHSAGDIILTTDADCRVGPQWISALTACFDDEKVKMVFGPVAYMESNSFISRFQSLEFAGLVASGAGAAMAGHPFLCNGANLAYRKESFFQVNGFFGNENYLSGDDVFLLHKMKNESGKQAIVFCKDEKAIVKTYPVDGLMKFISQRARWASKSKGYRDFLSIMTAIIVFSYSLTVLLTFFAGFFNPFWFAVSGMMFFVKVIADLPLLYGITILTGQRKLLLWIFPFQVVYPAYILVAGVSSLLKRKKW